MTSSQTTLRQRTCRQCARTFQGGPRAWYCPECRVERQRIQNAAHKQKKRRGETRELGTTDTCVVCCAEYEISGPNQKYCPSCATEAIAEVDRTQGLEWYAAHKDVYGVIRNVKRRVGYVICRECGKEFECDGTVRKYCSPECREKAKKRMQSLYDAKRAP